MDISCYFIILKIFAFIMTTMEFARFKTPPESVSPIRTAFAFKIRRHALFYIKLIKIIKKYIKINPACHVFYAPESRTPNALRIASPIFRAGINSKPGNIALFKFKP